MQRHASPVPTAGGGVNSSSPMFAAFRRATLLEHFRIPYRLDADLPDDGIEQVRLSADGPVLFWPAATNGRVTAATIGGGSDGHRQVPVFAEVLPDHAAEPLLAQRGRGWRRARSLTERDGREVGSIWRSNDGSVFLPFDPDEVILNYWSERYSAIGVGATVCGFRHSLMVLYYRLRPFLPRSLQIWLRRCFALVQGRSRFPRWPVETCLHDFFDLMLAILGGLAGEPVPYIAPWPDDHKWALVLTHDVEFATGWASRGPVLELERACGMRSSWNLRFVSGSWCAGSRLARALARRRGAPSPGAGARPRPAPGIARAARWRCDIGKIIDKRCARDRAHELKGEWDAGLTGAATLTNHGRLERPHHQRDVGSG